MRLLQGEIILRYPPNSLQETKRKRERERKKKKEEAADKNFRFIVGRKGYSTVFCLCPAKKKLNLISHSHRDNAAYAGNIYAVPRGELN